MRNLFLINIKRSPRVTLCLQSSINNPNVFIAQQHLRCSYVINFVACYRGQLRIDRYICYIVRYFLTDVFVHLRSNCKLNWKVNGVKENRWWIARGNLIRHQKYVDTSRCFGISCKLYVDTFCTTWSFELSLKHRFKGLNCA